MKLLVIRSLVDVPTEFAHTWMEEIVNMADSLDWDVVDLTDRAANRRMFEAWIQEHNPDLVIGEGHGFSNQFLGDDLKPIIDARNVHLLEGKTVFLFSCWVGRNIGRLIGEKGCFIGWNVPVSWEVAESEGIRETVLGIANLLLEGEGVQSAFQEAQIIMQEWIDFFHSQRKFLSEKLMRINKEGLMLSCPTVKLQTAQPINPAVAVFVLGTSGFILFKLMEKEEIKLSTLLPVLVTLGSLSLAIMGTQAN